MNFNECYELLSRIEGCTFAAMDTGTTPVLLGGKSNPMQGRIRKLALGHRVMLFSNKQSNGYLNKVRRELEREGKNPDSFKLSALPWGERVPDSPFIVHKGKHYLQCVFLASGSVHYLLDGFDIPKEAIQGLNERSGAEGQGLTAENEVIVRTFALESIISLRAFNKELA